VLRIRIRLCERLRRSIPPFEPPHLLNFDFDADLGPAFDFDADPDPAFHSFTDPDPRSLNDAALNSQHKLLAYGTPPFPWSMPYRVRTHLPIHSLLSGLAKTPVRE
jgi:hypothetical protein